MITVDELLEILAALTNEPEEGRILYDERVVPNLRFILPDEEKTTIYRQMMGLPVFTLVDEQPLEFLEWEPFDEDPDPEFSDFYSALDPDFEDDGTVGPYVTYTRLLSLIARNMEAGQEAFLAEFADSNEARLWYSENPLTLEEIPTEVVFRASLRDRFGSTLPDNLASQADAGVAEVHFEAPERLVIRHSSEDLERGEQVESG